MIVKNEEKYLPQCLNSIKDIIDEIIIVDTGSTDKTVEIAESFGAKVYHFQWTQSFSEARNVSLKYATKDWILILDADDMLCSEDIDKFIELKNSALDENSLYFFETLNYCGGFADSNNISVNLNPRLFKNNHGFYYEGEVHNQLVNSSFTIKDINYPIRIYHYGYLDESIKSKDKRKRNITLLEEQIKRDPNNKYAHFNLGNEYFALGDMRKALEYYYKSYENFNPNSGYGFILMLRIVTANYSIGEYNEALQFADIGSQYYPQVTDLHFLKANIYQAINSPTLAIKALEKCIELGEPPSELKFLYGTGGFKALYELANIYMKHKDYDAAYKYYIEAIRSKRDFIAPVYNIAHILKKEKTPIVEFKKTIENFFADYPKAYSIIADIFYTEGFYETALEYIIKDEEGGISSENILILKAKALVMTGAFEQCVNVGPINEESAYYFYISMYKVISSLLTEKQEYALSIVNSFKDKNLSSYNKKKLQIYEQLIKLFTKEATEVLSEDENEREYTAIIFEICEILLINKKFDEFEMSLNLLNLISDKSVLLILGKLYYKYGFIEMAKKEIIRSIKEFEVYDAEGMDILC
jgi:glycosyltransferase involved in cell wall biosynthesis